MRRADGQLPPEAVQIVAMRWWHLAQVLELELDIFDDPWSAEMYWSELAQRTRYYVVAEAPTSLVAGAPNGPDAGIPGVAGYAGLGMFGEPGAGGEAHVQTIGVAPQHRGTGLGRDLLRTLLVRAAGLGAPSVLLEVRTDNAVARALYERAGFVEVGVRRGYYQPSGADATVMRLQGPSTGIAALT